MQHVQPLVRADAHHSLIKLKQLFRYTRMMYTYHLSTFSLGSCILEDKHILHQYLELVDKYTLISPHLGVFLLSVFEGHELEQDIIKVRDVCSGEIPQQGH
jgi:hypothetical protein